MVLICAKIIGPPIHGIGQQAIKQATLRAGLVPFRSPLLRESHLVSFPPLINMLKFRGERPNALPSHRIFKGQPATTTDGTDTPRSSGWPLTAQSVTLSRATGFQGLGPLSRKDNSSRGCRQRLRLVSRYRDPSRSTRKDVAAARLRNQDRIPFRLD